MIDSDLERDSKRRKIDEVSEEKAQDMSSQPKTQSKFRGRASTSKPVVSGRPFDHKRNFLFNGIDDTRRGNIQMDEVATFSVTESSMADRMTDVIISRFGDVSNAVILDGMACVGGNTISFAQKFGSVLANELNKERYEMLSHNVRDVMQCANVTFYNESVISLATRIEHDILFLDPEWGGPDYKFKSSLRLPISDTPLEEFCIDVFRHNTRVKMIAVKLPVNYDNAYLEDCMKSENISYELLTNYRKMTLTILQKS